MSHVTESFEHNGFTVQVVQDEDAWSCNPRDNDGNYGVWLGFPHRSYDLGDEKFDPAEERIICSHCEGSGEEPGTEPEQDPSSAFTLRGADCTVCKGEGEVNPYADSEGRLTFESITAALKRERGARVVLPVGMLDHSGTHFYIGGGPHWSDSQGWDSGTCGFIYTSDEIMARFGLEVEKVTDEEIVKWLTEEIEEYDKWASGDVWGIVIEDVNGDTYESVWGFIGSEYAIAEAKNMANYLPESPAKLHTVRLTDADLDAIEAALDHAIQTPWDGYSNDVPAALDRIKAEREESTQ